jgi:hypothetical protein
MLFDPHTFGMELYVMVDGFCQHILISTQGNGDSGLRLSKGQSMADKP